MKRRKDNAGFDHDLYVAVWGRPFCVVTGESKTDLHHILGRGFDHGSRPGDDSRGKFSSLYNCVALSQGVHHGPLRDTVEMRWLFLRLADKKISQAILEGRYWPTEVDREFLEFRTDWKGKNAP